MNADEKVKIIADTMEKGGIVVSSLSWGAQWLTFFDEHSRGILAICGVLGLVITVIGGVLKWTQMTIEHRARMREIRGGGADT